MNVLLDANIVIAALLGSRATRTILISQQYNFYAPQWIIEEIKKYKKFICEKTRKTEEEFDIHLRSILVFIKIVHYAEYEHVMEKAKALIGKRDIKDSEYIACALAVYADYIWSNDKDFKAQKSILIKTTEEFIDDNR
ncbi:PIN domain-containing protein [Candidatus Woesearchaeota archaeon]|nr:PIN domain-containing protein [Candidatus Woesearchaeota archaeon]